MNRFSRADRALLSVALLTSLFSAPALAQDEWDLSFTTYLWGAGVEGTSSLGPVTTDIDLDFGDMLDMLDGALLGHFEAHKSGSALFGDVVYMALEPEPRVEFDSLIVEAGYLRKSDRQGGDSGWEIGIRYWDFDLKLTPSIASPAKGSDSWTDGFIGYRRSKQMGNSWRSVVRANVGTGGSDFSWGVDLTYLRDFRNSNALAVGLKFLDTDYERSGGRPLAIDASFAGVTIGYMFD